MVHWNTIGWVLLLGGFLFSIIVAWLHVGEPLWLGSYVAMLAGFVILVTYLSHTLWRTRQNAK